MKHQNLQIIYIKQQKQYIVPCFYNILYNFKDRQLYLKYFIK